MRNLAGLIIVLALVAAAFPARAQQFCTPRDEAVAQLEEQYGESVLGRGLTAHGKQMVELFVSEKGSWTVVASDPRGLSCILATGEDWQGIEVLAGDPA